MAPPRFIHFHYKPFAVCAARFYLVDPQYSLFDFGTDCMESNVIMRELTPPTRKRLSAQLSRKSPSLMGTAIGKELSERNGAILVGAVGAAVTTD